MNEKISRRKFLNYSAMGLAGLTILPGWSINGIKVAPSDRVVAGFIGLGRQGLSDFKSLSTCRGVQVAACSDVDFLKRERFKRRIEDWQTKSDMNPRCDVYEFYEKMLERKDIDVVCVATPDHWHALNTIHACESHKDVYVQKPLAFTIREGLEMVKAVRRNNTVLQVGSQQRSGKEFQKAIEVVRSGGIGHIEKIYVSVGEPPRPFDLPEMPVLANLNFNVWLGPLNDPKIHYHSDICPVITLEPEEKNETLWGAWRWYRETGNGYTADWGAHMFDIAQAAIGMDGSGPCEYIPKGYEGTDYLTMKYQNGIVMTEQPFLEDKVNAKGIRFIGTKGWLTVGRGYIACSNPDLVKNTMENKGEYEVSSPHMHDFIESVRSRRDPVAPVEVGCSTNTLCCLANMAIELKRPVKWNPATLNFIDDKEAEAHRLYNYQYRKPYSLMI